MTLTIYALIALVVFVLKFARLLEVFHQTNPWLKNIPFRGEFGLSTIATLFCAAFWPLRFVYLIGWIIYFLWRGFFLR